MPGFFVSNINNNDDINNYDNSRCFQDCFRYQEWTIQVNALNKFRNDKIFWQDDDVVIILDGIIFNKHELSKSIGCEDWKQTVKKLFEKEEDFYKHLRGCFCGAVLNKKTDKWFVFTDQIANRSVFVYSDNGHIAFGTQVNYFSEWMKVNGIKRVVDQRWTNDILSFGFVMDTHCILKGVTRVFPGSYAIINLADGTVQEKHYYRIQKNCFKKDEDRWIEELEETFQNAVDRIENKCKEYNTSLIVDVSGGLDSRMIAAHISPDKDRQIIGINYSQSGSQDQKVSSIVSKKLSIPLLQYYMDGGDCLKEIDDLVFMNQGMNFFSGITGGKKLLESLDRNEFGAEIWGALGDIYDGGIIATDGLSKPTWDRDQFRTSHMLPVYNKEGYPRQYPDNEILWFFVRAIFAGENTGFIRQNYVECPTPYGDVEYLNLLFSIPYELRADGHLLRKWMIKKYPELSRIRYSGTGVKVMGSDKSERIHAFPRKVKRKLSRMIQDDGSYSMNPMDFWLAQNEFLKQTFDDYYDRNVERLSFNKQLRQDAERLYCSASSKANDKILALTVISAVKQYVLE